MFDLSWSELLLIAAIALVVIGPKELPRVLRTIGQSLTKLRRMAGEFQSQFNAAMREAELDEIRNNVQQMQDAARSVTSSPLSSAALNPFRAVRDELRDAVRMPLDASTPASSTLSTATASDGVVSEEWPSVSQSEVAPAAHTSSQAYDSAPSPIIAKTRTRKQRPGKQRPGKQRPSRRVIVSMPQEAVKPLRREPRGAARMYRKTLFSALPVTARVSRYEERKVQAEGEAGEGQP